MSGRRRSVVFVHVGSPRHGVARYGRVLEAAVTDGVACTATRVADPAHRESADRLSAAVAAEEPDAVLFQFTDQQYGATPAEAAQAFTSLCAAVRAAAGAAVVALTVHDVPGRLEGAPRDGERETAYTTVVGAADVVTVCSQHEAARLQAIAPVTPIVIPHFVEPRPVVRGVLRRVVGVLGYLYPGKGHPEAIGAAARLAPPIDVIALGAPAPRHLELARKLARTADAAGIRLTVTGWIDDQVLDRELGAVGIPVVPNRDVSASGSLATWLGARRRPLVRAGPYTEEVAVEAPGCVELYDPHVAGSLLEAITRRDREPNLGWHDGVPSRLRPARIVVEHLQACGVRS